MSQHIQNLLGHAAPFINYLYILASVLFIIGLKMLSRADTARKGNLISAVGMLIAIVATCLLVGMEYKWILVGIAIGSAIGAIAAQSVKMTSMPEMVGLLNGFGGLASMLVAWAEYHKWHAMGWAEYAKTLLPDNPAAASEVFAAVAIAFTAVVGALTFSGSLIAFLKLAEWMPGKPILFRGQQFVNALVVLAILAAGAIFCMAPTGPNAYIAIAVLMVAGLILGITSVIPIGGADMPVVISLLNSYSGIAAAAAGFIILNNVLIVAGSLVGASGIILTQIMCKAMNRSLANVLFSGFGATKSSAKGEGYKGEAKPISAEDTYLLLEAARSVVIVPGYGMAVAQAQHSVRELGELLAANGCDVRYAIHPVAGRMPGHMNVLLAEANVPYEQLVEPQDVNPIMETVDVAMVIGANDVVNPAAREDKSSPIYGMPIINVDQAKTVIILKRSMASGFAGIDNPLFFKDNSRMLFGDAKATVSALVSEFKSA
ncbi:MAG: NAD(P)(+) transhydrogenase (Re/Si-specific) subunit beta [Kiritimatiellae bacterium]|nr:NAD(P)(+) transhydrogenase (Re/Si-specific) subunit beta [Kiritimatiellia bacterium]MCO5061288.1 NAD(P)(+) transhydrogenase (Re/Si-specific) subunit beta [Kiritimatiellia bacterium]MCO6400202.1 NAD(P)(+) transhydrogenase (Re/Si-specific) subunit beta [Verrucomicrobiota bacterium]